MTNINIDLNEALSNKVNLLDAANKAFSKRGQDYAKAEHDYRIALAEKMLSERDKGTPVTIIGDICRGDRYIAKLKMERDCAEVVYKSAGEAINNFKLQIRVIDSQINREYNS
jgi:hypothetical protein